MIDFHFDETEALLIANALRYYVASGLLTTEDSALAADLIDELSL